MGPPCRLGSLLSASAKGTRAGCAPTRQSSVGATRHPEQSTRRAGASPALSPARTSRVGYAPTAPASAGAEPVCSLFRTGRSPTSTRVQRHWCGLRSDGAVDCWGDNSHGQADGPDGRFTAVTAGGNHSCGLRSDGAVDCWGADGSRQSDAPEGQFTAVSAGPTNACGVRADGAIDCWGDNGLVSSSSHVPEGRFTTIAIAPRYSCGLRIDRTISCWRLDHYGQTGSREGEFQAVAVSETIACALDTNGGIVCSWDRELLEGEGPLTLGEIQPWGRFTSLVVGATHACALGADGNIFCWEPVMRDIGIADHPALISIADYGQADAPRGQYTAVAIGKWHSCGLRVGQTVTCWGDNAAGQTDTPDGQFSSIAAGGHSSCGLRADGRIECWGAIAQFDPSLGLFAAVSLGDRHACALRVDRTVACWGDNTNGPDRRARRRIHDHHRCGHPFLRPAHRRDNRLLGPRGLAGATSRSAAPRPPSRSPAAGGRCRKPQSSSHHLPHRPPARAPDPCT